MRKKIDVRKNICLLGAVIMLGACGQAESGETTTAAETETQAVETTVAEKESGDKDAAEKKESQAASGKDAEGAEDTKETKEEKDSADKNGGEEQETDQDGDGGAAEDAGADTANGQQAETKAQGADAADGSNTQTAAGAAAATDPQTPGSQQGGKSVAGIYEEIAQKVSLVSPMVVPDDFISNYYGIDVSTLDEYVFSMSEAAISAETIVILKAKDSGSTGALSAALQTVIDQKRSEMENYLPDQFQIVDKSSVQVKGDYVYLVISEQAAAIEPIIQAGIS